MTVLNRLVSLACGLILFTHAGVALAQMKVGVIISSTGPISVVGIPQKNTVALLPKEVGGIAIDYIVLDDASDPTQTVQYIKKLLSEDKVDAIIGPSGSANAVGVIGFMAEAATPLLAPVGTTAVVLRWTIRRSGSSRPRRTTISSPPRSSTT